MVGQGQFSRLVPIEEQTQLRCLHLGYTATFNAVAGSPVNLPAPLLRAVIEKTLTQGLGRTDISS